jgi:hypothetical protein
LSSFHAIIVSGGKFSNAIHAPRKLNTAAGQIPGTATFAWNAPGRDAKGRKRENAPNAGQGRTQERGRDESGEALTKASAPGTGLEKTNGASGPQRKDDGQHAYLSIHQTEFQRKEPIKCKL